MLIEILILIDEYFNCMLPRIWQDNSISARFACFQIKAATACVLLVQFSSSLFRQDKFVLNTYER